MLNENYAKIQSNIVLSCKNCHRSPASVKLLAISKTRGVDEIMRAHKLGINDFGENRIQEAAKKISILRAEKLVWHFVGRLQSNKAKKAVSLFEVIHSISSPELAEKVNDEALRQNKHQKVLLQINVSGESTKGGFSEEELFFTFPSLLSLPNLTILGLMTIAPIEQDKEKLRPLFSKLRSLKESLESRNKITLPELSMGMSSDFDVAIEEGATIIRLGTALFGERLKTEK